MCDCENGSIPQQTGYNASGTTMVYNHGDCEGVTVDLLSMFLRLFQCVKTNNLHAMVSISVLEIDNAISLLNEWISIKQQNPASCENQEKLPLLQSLINNIVQFGRC